jgi:4-diphosphocytidyl-2-C-methyl-D-erythritol kinase
VTKSNPESSTPAVSVLAPAKINLILRILDRRSDGYHNLWSIMQTVALEDEVRISLSSSSQDIRLRCDSVQLATDQSNLVYKAASAVMERVPRKVGIEIELRKSIPVGAGLGGGSSDAAATILGLNHALRLGWSQQEMAELAQPLGSDVPFFFYAPTASVGGRGESVRPLPLAGSKWVVLVNPGFGVETRWAYQELAATRNAVRPLSDPHLALGQEQKMSWSQLAACAENDFEAPVFAKHPLLMRIKRTLLDQGAEIALLSGSGATVFGLFSSEAEARRAADGFVDQRPLKSFVVPTCCGPLITR